MRGDVGVERLYSISLCMYVYIYIYIYTSLGVLGLKSVEPCLEEAFREPKRASSKESSIYSTGETLHPRTSHREKNCR